nr:hypothetical protein [Tanacetum cinerariifolium]
QPAKAKSSSDLSKAARTEAEQLKIVLRKSRQKTHISQHGGSSTDEGTGSKLGVLDVPSDESKERNEDDDDNDEEEEIAKINEPADTESGGGDEEVAESNREDEEEETRQEEEESFDPILRTPEDDENDGNDKTILESYGESAILKRRREDNDDQEGPSAGSDRGPRDKEKVGSMHQLTLHLNQLPGMKADQHQGINLDRCAEDQPMIQPSQHPEWFSQPRKPLTPDREWNKTLPAIQGSAQPWISELAKQAVARSSFNELLDTPIDFSNFIMNRLGVDTLTLNFWLVLPIN